MCYPSDLVQDLLIGVLCVILVRKEVRSVHEHNYVASEKAGVCGMTGIKLGIGLFLLSRFTSVFEPLSVLLRTPMMPETSFSLTLSALSIFFLGLGFLFCSAALIRLSLSEDRWKRDRSRPSPRKKRNLIVLGVFMG